MSIQQVGDRLPLVTAMLGLPPSYDDEDSEKSTSGVELFDLRELFADL
jgi:hypothetical protein